jgi:branched-chain amino acid aminotransferase
VGPITKQELFEADEAFFSGTAVEVTAITKVIDGSSPESGEREYTIGDGKPGELWSSLEKAYRDVVEGRSAAYQDWLTYVNE